MAILNILTLEETELLAQEKGQLVAGFLTSFEIFAYFPKFATIKECIRCFLIFGYLANFEARKKCRTLSSIFGYFHVFAISNE